MNKLTRTTQFHTVSLFIHGRPLASNSVLGILLYSASLFAYSKDIYNISEFAF